MKSIFANFISPMDGIALQVARQIAPCDRALREKIDPRVETREVVSFITN